QSLAISQGLGNIQLHTWAFYDDGDVDDYIGFHNTTTAPSYDQEGMYERDGDMVNYVNAEEENYTISDPLTIITTYLKLTANIANAAQVYRFAFAGYQAAGALTWDLSPWTMGMD